VAREQPSPEVVFEVISPRSPGAEWAEKFAFDDDHGVEEYYLCDPESNLLAIYVRNEGSLMRVRRPWDYVSPRLDIRFERSGPEMMVRRPDGRPFLSFEELQRTQEQTEQRAEQERGQRLQAEQRANRLAELAAGRLPRRNWPNSNGSRAVLIRLDRRASVDCNGWCLRVRTLAARASNPDPKFPGFRVPVSRCPPSREGESVP
jgi:hypothetical protein